MRPTWNPSLSKKVVYSCAQFWTASRLPYKLNCNWPTHPSSPSSKSSLGLSMKMGLVCTFDVDDGKTIRLGPCLTSCTHGTQEFQRLQWWNRRKEIGSVVELTSPRDQRACFDSFGLDVSPLFVSTHFVVMTLQFIFLATSRSTFLYTHIFLKNSISSFLACPANSQFSGFQSFTSSQNFMPSYINLQRSISASSS